MTVRLDDIHWHAVVAADLNPDKASDAMRETERHVARLTGALMVYARDGRGDGPVPDIIADVLTDIRHLCKGLDVDFTDLVERSARRFAEEDVDE
jgi:hypothetical protein